jgi:hypothetical protein
VNSATLLYVKIAGRTPECWSPASGAEIAPGIFRIVAVQPGDAVEFQVGELVRCEMRAFPDGSEALLALERAVAPS